MTVGGARSEWVGLGVSGVCSLCRLFDSVARSCMQKQTPMGREHEQGPAMSVP